MLLPLIMYFIISEHLQKGFFAHQSYYKEIENDFSNRMSELEEECVRMVDDLKSQSLDINGKKGKLFFI